MLMPSPSVTEVEEQFPSQVGAAADEHTAVDAAAREPLEAAAVAGDLDDSLKASSFASNLRKTVKAARKKAKRKRRVTIAPILADNAKAAAVVDHRCHARADGGEKGGDPQERTVRQQVRERLRQRGPDPPTPLQVDEEAAAAVRLQRCKARADGGGKGGDAQARAFRRRLVARLKQREAEAEALLIGGRPPAKVAIVGAGPTGLWLGVLLARKHASFANGPNGQLISRNLNAPTIHIFEKRQRRGAAGGSGSSTSASTGSSKAHGGRSIVLAITQQTQQLLNSNLLGRTISSCASNAFAPTSRIGDIERILLDEFERFVAAGFGDVHFDADVPDPDELHEESRGGFDVVVVASGRRTLTDEWRAARQMQSVVEGTAAAAIVEFYGARPSADGWASVVAAASRALSPAQIFVRPGADSRSGWVWFVGLPEALSERIREGQQRRKASQPGREEEMALSLVAALEALLAQGEGGGCSVSSAVEASGGRGATATLAGQAGLFEALRTLDVALKAKGAKAGWTEASYWRSSSVMHAPEGARGPTLLVGDTCCGRPFWLGSTLNGHFSDVAQLALAPCWNAWDYEADGDAPFRGYLERMRTLRRCGPERRPVEYRRPTAEESATEHYDLGIRRGDGGAAAGTYLAKTLAAVEMRRRARAVGVNRTGLSSSSMIELKVGKGG